MKFCINNPNDTFWAIALEGKWAHMEKEKNISKPDGILFLLINF